MTSMTRRLVAFSLVAVLAFGATWQPAAAQRADEKAAPAPAAAADAGLVAAAASLRVALDEIAKQFEAQGGTKITITYGATNNLVRQVEEGAPFQIFLAADEASVARLEKAGKTEGAPQVLVEGRLAIVVPQGSPVTPDASLEGLKKALADGKVRHISIANPELAPYGKAAREALQKVGLWDLAQPLLVQGENVGQAVQFVTTGAAEVGLVAQSLLIAPDVAAKVTQVAVDKSLHAPLRQGMALLKNAGPESKAFYAFLTTPAAKAVFEKNGFNVP